MIHTFLLLSTALILGQMTALCQSNGGIGIQGPALILTYMSADTSSILEKWKLEEEETVDIQDLLDIQTDVFGKFEYPKTYNLSESFSKKYTVSTMELDKVFARDQSAQVVFEIYKGKKKKHPYMLQEISISSSSQSLEPFMDSLCAPYIDLILAGKTDSLVESAFHAKELKQAIENLGQDASEKEIEKADMMYGFMMFAREIVEDAVVSIDVSKKPSFGECKVTLKIGDPSFSVQYFFTGKDEKKVHCTFSFTLEEGVYQLSGLGAGTGSRRQF